jgi:hypothetical protein
MLACPIHIGNSPDKIALRMLTLAPQRVLSFLCISVNTSRCFDEDLLGDVHVSAGQPAMHCGGHSAMDLSEPTLCTRGSCCYPSLSDNGLSDFHAAAGAICAVRKDTKQFWIS